MFCSAHLLPDSRDRASALTVPWAACLVMFGNTAMLVRTRPRRHRIAIGDDGAMLAMLAELAFWTGGAQEGERGERGARSSVRGAIRLRQMVAVI